VLIGSGPLRGYLHSTGAGEDNTTVGIFLLFTRINHLFDYIVGIDGILRGLWRGFLKISAVYCCEVAVLFISLFRKVPAEEESNLGSSSHCVRTKNIAGR